MNIALKSELDSRIVLYPLMRTLMSYGSIFVLTSNPLLRRLLDDEAFQSFRNITIVVDEQGATDDIYNDYGITSGDFDFIILDNVGALDYDFGFILMGSGCSEAFKSDVELLEQSDEERNKNIIIQFGNKPKEPKEKKEQGQAGAAKGSTEGQNTVKTSLKKQKGKEVVTDEDYDPAAKFREKVEGKKEERKTLKVVTAPFPSFKDIELVEGEHKFYSVPDALIKLFYDVFKKQIASDSNQFRKEVTRKDESSGYIQRTLSDR